MYLQMFASMSSGVRCGATEGNIRWFLQGIQLEPEDIVHPCMCQVEECAVQKVSAVPDISVEEPEHHV